MFVPPTLGSIGAAQAAAAAARAAVGISVCNDMRPCFACAFDDFERECTSGGQPDKIFQLFGILLKQYVNTFGAALLAAQGIAITVLPDQRSQHSKTQGIEKYTASEVATLLRGFALFYVLFKVDAPDEVKKAWWALTLQLAEWMVRRGYVPADFDLSFDPCDDDAKINAICGAGLINQAAEQREIFEEDCDKVRQGEPYYLVSKVVPGKIWFLHAPSIGKCAEFGPITVPPAVAGFIKPGWGLDCKFVSIGGRWHITKVDGVLPI